MRKIEITWSFLPRGLRAQLVWSYLLMSAVPLMMLLLVAAWFAFPTVRAFYQLERWFPLIAAPAGGTWWLIGVLMLTIVVSWMGGLYLTIRVIEPVIRISRGAAKAAKGEYDVPMPVDSQDEISDLTVSLNHLTGRIRENLTELKQFGERTTSLNFEIHKRMVCLSGLLQIGELMMNGAELDMVLDLIVEKVATIDEQSFAFLSLQPTEELTVAPRRAHGIDLTRLSTLLFDSSHGRIDASHAPSTTMQATWEQLERPNLLLEPITLRHRLVGTLAVGNYQPNHQWSSDTADLINLFVKQASIAMENEVLVKRTRTLTIRDELTGVYTESYIRQRLSEELGRAVATQRPCAFAVLNLHHFEDFRRRRGEPESERALKKTARLIQECVTDIDRVGRLNGHELAVVLPERNKRQAIEMVETIRKRVAEAFASATEPADRLTLIGGVAENPLDGASAEELITKACGPIRASGRSGSGVTNGQRG